MAVIAQFPAGVKNVDQKSGVGKWVSVQVDPSANVGVLFLLFCLLHTYVQVILGLRKPLLMPTVIPNPCLSSSLLDLNLLIELFISPQEASG